MAPKKKPDLVTTVQQAARKLDDVGEPVLASGVREMAQEYTRLSTKSREDNPTLSLWVDTAAFNAAQAAGSVLDIIDQGFLALLAGGFKPQRPRRGASGETARGSRTARATVDRQREVTAYVTAHAEELGWEPTPRQVAAAWIEQQFGPRGRD